MITASAHGVAPIRRVAPAFRKSSMPLELNWRPHPLVSCLHAAEAVGRKLPLADPRLTAALELPALQLAAEIRAAQLPVDRFWRQLLAQAGKTENRRQLVETAVARVLGRAPGHEPLITILTACVMEVEAAADRAAKPRPRVASP
jgi:hypothetical protein